MFIRYETHNRNRLIIPACTLYFLCKIYKQKLTSVTYFMSIFSDVDVFSAGRIHFFPLLSNHLQKELRGLFAAIKFIQDSREFTYMIV